MINTMRLKQLYTILLLLREYLFCPEQAFDKYADMDDVTSVYISKRCFR